MPADTIRELVPFGIVGLWLLPLVPVPLRLGDSAIAACREIMSLGIRRRQWRLLPWPSRRDGNRLGC